MSNNFNEINAFLKHEKSVERFREISGRNPNQFLVSVLQAVRDNDLLSQCTPISVLNAAATAAAMNLPINNQLGYSYLVPFYDKRLKSQAAQLQIGYKGFIQLALRTQQYKWINTAVVYENQFKSFNRYTEFYEIDFSLQGKGQVVGYMAGFVLNSGFKKNVFWKREEIAIHAEKYSKTYNSRNSPWKSEFDKMAQKTVLKLLLHKWGPQSIELEKAVIFDQSVQYEEPIPLYPDNPMNDGNNNQGGGSLNFEQNEKQQEKQRVTDHITDSDTIEKLKKVEKLVAKHGLKGLFNAKLKVLQEL